MYSCNGNRDSYYTSGIKTPPPLSKLNQMEELTNSVPKLFTSSPSSSILPLPQSLPSSPLPSVQGIDSLRPTSQLSQYSTPSLPSYKQQYRVCHEMASENQSAINILKKQQDINKRRFGDLNTDVQLIKIQNENLQDKFLEIKKENVKNYGIVDEKLRHLHSLLFEYSQSLSKMEKFISKSSTCYLLSKDDYFELHNYKIYKLGKLIGKNSENLKSIKSLYSIRIKIPSRKEQKNGKPIKIYPVENTIGKHMMHGIQHVQNIVG